MKVKFTATALFLALAACGSSNPDGTPATGPLGQPLLMTDMVKQVTTVGLNACIDARTGVDPVARLTAAGFTSWRGGYRAKFDNPLIFGGDSSVSVMTTANDCRVGTWPVYPIELQTMQTLTRQAIAARGAPVSARNSFTSGRAVAEAIIQ